MQCPNCGTEINPASELGKLTWKKHKRTSEYMKQVRAGKKGISKK